MRIIILSALLALGISLALVGAVESYAQTVTLGEITGGGASFEVENTADETIWVRVSALDGTTWVSGPARSIAASDTVTVTTSGMVSGHAYHIRVNNTGSDLGDNSTIKWIYVFPSESIYPRTADNVEVIKLNATAMQIFITNANPLYYRMTGPDNDPDNSQDGIIRVFNNVGTSGRHESGIRVLEDATYLIWVSNQFATLVGDSMILEYTHPNDAVGGVNVTNDGPLRYHLLNVSPEIDDSNLGGGGHFRIDVDIGTTRDVVMNITDTETLTPDNIKVDNPRIEVLPNADIRNSFILRFTPIEEDHGDHDIDITVTDAGGLQDTAMLRVDVRGDFIFTGPLELEVQRGGSAVLDLRLLVTTIPSNLLFEINRVTQGEHGIANTLRNDEFGFNRVVRYTADSLTFTGNDTFTIHVRVEEREKSPEVSVRIVDPVPDGVAPEARSFAALAIANRSTPIDLTIDDRISDAGQSARTLTVSAQTPGDGTVTVEDTTITYDASSVERGVETITYTVSDIGNLTDDGIITVAVLPHIADIGVEKHADNPNDIQLAFSNITDATLYYALIYPDGTDLFRTDSAIDGGAHTSDFYTLDQNGTYAIQMSNTPGLPDDESVVLNYTHPNDAGSSITPNEAGPLIYNAPVNVAPTIDQETLGDGVEYVNVRIGVANNIALNIDDTETLAPEDITTNNTRIEVLAGSEPNVFVLRFVPDESDRGRMSINITVTDAGGLSDTAILYANGGDDFVIPQPMPVPVPLQAPDIDVEATPGMLASVQPDIGTDGLITDATGATMGTIAREFLADGTIGYTANAGASGIDEVTYTVSGGSETAQGTVYFYINAEGNERPALKTIPGIQTEGTATFAAEATDGDDTSLTYIIRNAPDGATIDGTGAFSWDSASANSGDYIFNVVVHDDTGGLDVQKMAVTVRDPANDNPTAPVVHRRTTSDTSILIAPDIRDPEGQPTGMILAVGAEGGTVSEGFLGANIIAYIPQDDGTDIISYTTSDGAGGATTSTVYVHTGESANPDLDSIRVQRVEVSGTLEFQASASDEDGAGTSYIMDGAPAGATLDGDTGAFSWTPGTADAGDHTFTITAYDSQGGFDTEPVAISVSEPGTTNRDPNITDFDAAALQNNPRFITLRTSDPDEDPTGIILATNATTGTIRQDLLQSGIIAYVPETDRVGVDAITYAVSDRRGGVSTGTIYVHIKDPVNDEPTLAPIGNRQVSVPGTLTFDVTASDNEDDPLTYAIRNAPAGATINNATGTFSWTPATTDAGDHTFTVTVRDDAGGFATEDILVTVIDPQSNNQPPTAPDESSTTTGDRTVIFPNISDPDGDDTSIIAATGAFQGLVDSELLKDSIIAYTPFPGTSGTDIITYTVSDGRGGLATGTITINISSGS